MTAKMDDLIPMISDMRDAVLDTLPNSRERSLVLTHLDDARHWINDALTLASYPKVSATND